MHNILSDFCFECGLFGHKFQLCTAAFTKDAMIISTCEFGPWLKAENHHIPNPRNKKSTFFSHILNQEFKIWCNKSPDPSKFSSEIPKPLHSTVPYLNSHFYWKFSGIWIWALKNI